MRSPCDVPSCPRPDLGDPPVCHPCLERLVRSLRLVTDGLTRELDLALARQRRTGPGNMGRRSTDTPLAYDTTAAEAHAVLRNTLAAWAHALLPEPPAPDDTLGATLLLLRHTGRTPRSDLDPTYVDEIIAAVAQAEHAVDLPSERILAGTCAACDTPCYASPDSELAFCRHCDRPVDVVEGRRRLLLSAGEHLVTAAEAARALGVLGHRVSAASVRGHARRGRLASRGTGKANRPLYRLGEVMDVCADNPARA